MSLLRRTSTRMAPHSRTSLRVSPSTGEWSLLAWLFSAVVSSRMRPFGSARMMGLLLCTFDLRADTAQLLLDRLVTAIEVVDAEHVGLALRDEAREHEARRCPEVGRHHRRAGQLHAALRDRGAAGGLD